MGWIETSVNQIAGLPDDPTLRAFQMTIEGRMVDVSGRHLPAPELMYNRPVRQVSWTFVPPCCCGWHEALLAHMPVSVVMYNRPVKSITSGSVNAIPGMDHERCAG